MIVKVLIVKNSSLEGPGLINYVLMKNDICWDVIDLEKSDRFPDIKKYNAVFILGGPDSANDRSPKIILELEKIGKALSIGIPLLGICLGMQLLAKAAGGMVERCKRAEIGWRGPDDNSFEVKLNHEGKMDPLFKKVTDRIKVFQLHAETAKLNENIRLLGTSTHCCNQVIKVGSNAYGIQGHIELSRVMLFDWLNHMTDFQNIEYNSILKYYDGIKTDYQTSGKTIIENFLKISGLI